MGPNIRPIGGAIDETNVLGPLLIFDGVLPDSKIAGFMYVGAAEKPEGFAGPNDHWHYHTNTCIVTNADGGIDTPFGADREATQAQCDAVGGRLIQNTGTMVHVWSVPGYENPRGVFAEINPALKCPDGTYYAVPMEEIGFSTSSCASEH
jgi:hypothetical protein